MKTHTVPTTATTAVMAQITTSYHFHPKTLAPAQTGMMMAMTMANPLPSRLSTFSKDGMINAPITAKTARMTRIRGRMIAFVRSRRSCWTSAAVAFGPIEGERGGVDDGESVSVT